VAGAWWAGKLACGLLLAARAASTVVSLAAAAAVLGQCAAEDRAMRRRFGAAHAHWSDRTSMLIPGVL
jgi:protein-S-isoprenylcysteine O-methyltransferase Ste14